MATDDERREVARRLREIADRHDGVAATIVERRLGLESDERFLAGSVFTSKSVGRLADLIEPSEPKVRCVAEVKFDGERLEQLAYDAAVELTGIDRDALLALADELDRVGYNDWLHSGEWKPEEIARRIREAVDACEARPDTPAAGDKEQTATDAHADGNEAADGARTPSIEVLRWVNGRGGLDAVRESVEQSECRKKLLDCFAMRLGFESLEDSGDILKELEKRIMPEGYEWPRYESGELLRYRDRYISDGSECEVWHIDFDSYGEATILNSDCSKCSLEKGERVKRPTVLAGDGEPLEVGQTVWRDDGEMLEVLYLRPDGLVDCCGEIERPERLTHERPDSWERLERDANASTCTYFGATTKDCEICGHVSWECSYDKASDLVRRCKALAEKENRNE